MSIMTQAPLRKRDREPEALPDSSDVREPKRFQSEEADRFLQLLQFQETLADDEEEEFAPSEELVNRLMKILEEEIAATTSSSSSSNSGDNLAASDTYGGHEGETVASDSRFDLYYLLEASDEELGIPPNPVLDLKNDICQSMKETSEGLLESPNPKSPGENWHLEDNFENYLTVCSLRRSCDASQLQDCINRDSVSHNMLFEGDFSAAWRLKTVGGMQ